MCKILAVLKIYFNDKLPITIRPVVIFAILYPV